MAALRDIVAGLFPAPAGGAAEPVADDHGLFPPDAATPVVLVTAFGIREADLDAALNQALATQPRTARVVCLTDQPDFAALRRRGIAFEYLPPPAARSATLADPRSWQAYLTERHDILLAKWRPDHVVAAGQALEQFLAG